MIYKTRGEPKELSILHTLNKRLQLPNKSQTYHNLKKGYEGELLFDKWVETLTCPCLVLNDLLLRVNNHLFQLDSLLICNHQIYVFEVKNFEGDYYYQDNCFYQKTKSEKEISNPLLQLERTNSLLRQLLHKLDYAIPVHSFAIFINPEFMLYQAPMDNL